MASCSNTNRATTSYDTGSAKPGRLEPAAPVSAPAVLVGASTRWARVLDLRLVAATRPDRTQLSAPRSSAAPSGPLPERRPRSLSRPKHRLSSPGCDMQVGPITAASDAMRCKGAARWLRGLKRRKTRKRTRTAGHPRAGSLGVLATGRARVRIPHHRPVPRSGYWARTSCCSAVRSGGGRGRPLCAHRGADLAFARHEDGGCDAL